MPPLPTLKLYKPDGSFVIVNAEDEEQLSIWREKGYTLDTPRPPQPEPVEEPEPAAEEPIEEVTHGASRRGRKRAQYR